MPRFSFDLKLVFVLVLFSTVVSGVIIGGRNIAGNRSCTVAVDVTTG